jgi:hypothetical protein
MQTKVKVQDAHGVVQEKDATILNPVSTKENWNEYLLEDGTALFIKQTLIEVLKVEGEYDLEGNPIYLFKTTQLVKTTIPPSLKRK